MSLAPSRYDYEYYEERVANYSEGTASTEWEVSVNPSDEGGTIRISFRQTGSVDPLLNKLRRSAETCEQCREVLEKYGLNRVYMNKEVFDRIVAFVENVWRQHRESSSPQEC